MICNSLISKAARQLPKGYHVRFCREDELDTWKAMQFDTVELAREYYGFMTDYYNQVYLKKGDLFFQRCVFVCDDNDKPIGTCFLWKAYGEIWTLHWFRVLNEYEGKGIGRALLSYVMQSLPLNEYPVFLHTHPSRYRAIKLYSDIGFKLLTDPVVGSRENDLEECMPILEKYMFNSDFEKLQFAIAPQYFLDVVSSSKVQEF
ncbi:GNAT family N-acetyltransferase [Virgibacillus indicus]|uniref:GNAT family N-acetyltransferase n=2 Tax=Virgibacillus indicus TaxID=2024554 RepID=A0A265N6L2_9BACI|nr:GNAT family N-acetyltransferase [Virgibacillus indicus]